MTQHAQRDHAVWSASSTDRNWQCAGALALTMDLPESTNEAADWGTACHQISEKCLREGTQAEEYIGTTEKGKKYEFVVDDEMAETAQKYVDFVRQQVVAAAPKHTNPADLLHIEQRFSLADLNPPFDAGGTADAVIWAPESRLLHVVDLKGGRGVVVEAKQNPQLRTYALGAMMANPQWKPTRIKVTIVQPRAAHPDGRIRSEEFDTADLIEWTMDLVAAMKRADLALASHRDGQAPAATWNAAYLNPGSHCRFCKAAGFCPALEKQAMDAAGVWLDDHSQPHLANTPHPTDPDARRDRLDLLEVIEGWIKSVRAYEHAQAEAGDLPTDYVLVESQGREKFKDEAEVIAKLTAAEVPPELFLNEPKLRTPKQVRAELAKKKNGVADKLALLEDASHTPITGTTLVRATKTTRAAVPSNAERFLENHTTSLFD